MLVVHALWSPGRGVLLWAEDGGRPARTTGRALRTARPHPFAAPAAELHRCHPGTPTTVTLLLPSRTSGPEPSPGLVRGAEHGRAPGRARSAPTLRPWSVPALLVDPAELADPAPGVRYDPSVSHLRALVELADDLAARGRVLPTVTRVDGRPTARWRPVRQGLDAAAFDALVAALPAAGRAEVGRISPALSDAGTGPVGADPWALCDDALGVLVDTAVRDRLARAAAPPALTRPSRSVPDRSTAALPAFLIALTAPDGRLDRGRGPAPRSLTELGEHLRGWDAVGDEPAGAARGCFRLVEVPTRHDPADPGPDPRDETGDGTRFAVEFLLRSRADPSLLVPAAQVWDGGADRLFTAPAELLLEQLGRAGQVLDEIADALRTARPETMDLDLDGAHRFLTDGAPRLLAAGFDVQLPAGWRGRAQIGLSVTVAGAAGRSADRVVVRGGLGRESLAEFRWSLSVDDDELSEDEIGELVAAKAPLVRLRGRWVALDADRLAAGVDFLRRTRARRDSSGAAGPAGPTLAEVLALVGHDPTVDADGPPLPVSTVHAQGHLAALLAGTAERSLTPLDPAPGFTATLRPYQERGVAWLAFLADLGLGACLADDMGLGKTVQLLALEAHERRAPSLDSHLAAGPAEAGLDETGSAETDAETGPTSAPPGRPSLLVCPMSMIGTWQREAARFAPDLRVHAHHGPARPIGDALAAVHADADLFVTTYGTLVRDVDALAALDWRRLVLDEAQLVKNSHAAPARAVRRISAAHRVALTGTPVENRLSELWSIMDVLNPGMLGTAQRFRERFAVPVERHASTEAAGLLRRITRPYLLRRTKTDPTIIDDLPEKIEITQHYRLTREQASLYRTVVDDMMERIEGSDGIARRGNVLAAMTKLKQVCNHPAHLLHDGSPLGRRSGKVVRIEELLTQIVAEGDRALCFTQFTEFGHLLVGHLAARLDTDIAFLHGGVPQRRREDIVRRFQAGDGPAVLLLSLKAGGTGLTLTRANHVLHLDRWWNPAVEDQATDRAFRIGQRRTVQVRKFVCPGTVEERIDEMITRKKGLSSLVVSDGESWLTELSTGSLRELFTLSADAVGEPDGGDDDLRDDAARTGDDHRHDARRDGGRNGTGVTAEIDDARTDRAPGGRRRGA